MELTMSDNCDNNNTSWNADKSLILHEMNELGCEVLNYKSDNAHERKKRDRSIVKIENNAYNDVTAAEARDFADTQRAKFIKAENFRYRQIGKPVVVTKDGFSSLSDEIVLGILKYLYHEDLKYVSQVNQRFRRLCIDESLWPRLDLAGKILNSNALTYILKRGVKVLRLKEATVLSPIWDSSSLAQSHFFSKVELLDLSYCVISLEDLSQLLATCRSVKKLSLEGCKLSHDVCREISQNLQLDTLNLAMAEGLDCQSLSLITTSCERLQHVNLAWTHLNKETINNFVNSVSKNLLTVNLSGLGFSVANRCIRTLVQRCPRLVELDISDCVDVSSLVLLDIAEALPNLKALAISRCYKIDPKVLMTNLEKMPSLLSLTAFRILNSADTKDLEAKHSLLRVNKDYYSTIARPTVGLRRTSIWLTRCRE